MTTKKVMLLMRRSFWLLILLMLFSSALYADPANKSSKELLALKGEGFLLYLGDRDFDDTQQQPGLELRIEGVSTALFEYLSLEKPSRFVIDITGLQVLRPESMDVQENPLVRRIRVGVHEKKTRIVLDLKLKKAPRFVVSDEGNAKIFRLLPDDAPYAQEGILIVPQKETPPMLSPTPSLIEEPTNKPEASPPALSLFEEPRLPTPEFTPTPEMLETQFSAPSETSPAESQIRETESTPGTVEEEQPTIVPTETPTKEFSPTPTETPEEELEKTPTPTPQEEEPTATPTETATETSTIITSREAEIAPVATPVMNLPLVSTTTPEEVPNIPLIEGQKPSTPSL
ncbi:MAG: AMIN domain-containing protein, partial [SAR324 cluster bacterium]|nr:AMIN domain-containing protein [SAR324 cluster bacterium]